MPFNVVFNSVTYPIPVEGDKKWGPPLTRYLVALANGAVSTLTGTPNRVIVTPITGGFNLSLPQDLATTSNVTFNSVAVPDNVFDGNGVTLGNGKSIFFGNSPTSQFVTLNAPTLSASYTLHLPLAQASAGQFLQNDGAGNLSWNTLAGTGTVNTGVTNTLAYYTAATNVVSSLTAITPSRALVSNGSGLPVASAVTTTELGFVSGVTSAIQTQINTLSVTPTGMITMFGAAVAPAGWLLCDGTSYTTAGQPNLFSVIGYTFGGGGANFNVPNFINNVPVGAGSIASLGTAVGAATHAVSIPELPTHSFTVAIIDPTHTHTVNDPSHAHELLTYTTTGTNGNLPVGQLGTQQGSSPIFGPVEANTTGITINSHSTGVTATTTPLGSGTAISLVQPSLGITFIIKT